MTNTQLNQPYFNPKQLKLPLSFEILIPFDSEVRTFDEVLRRINLKQYLVSDQPIGRVPYNPINMLKLILFCHMVKIRSSRDMESAAANDIRMMWLTDEMKPAHTTINEFIKNKLKSSIKDIFYEINNYIIDQEKIETDQLYIDGTKIESRANKYTFVWKGSIEKFKIKLNQKITNYLNHLSERYRETGIYFPIQETYTSRDVGKVKDFIEKDFSKTGINAVYGKGRRKTPLQRDYDEVIDYYNKLKSYERDLKIIGCDRNSYAKTDKDATFMHMKEDHMRNSQLKPGYNIQIGVSDEYILHVDIFNDRGDYRTFEPFLEGYNKAYGYYPKYPVADAGYGGLTNYRYVKSKEMDLYQKYGMYSKDTKDKKRMNDPYIAMNLKKDEKGRYLYPDGGTLKYLYRNKRGNDVYQLPNSNKKMEINEELLAYQKEARENLTSELGIELRIQRSIQVEGAFGVLKEDFGFRRFRRCGTENVKLEFLLLVIGYNLAKFHNKRYRIIQ
ncbi:MAG: transposase [Bacillota bacterium]